MPRFSIIIPTYNRAALVGAAVASVLAQTLGDLEVIVVDDGSTDNTAQVVQTFQSDARVQYVAQPNQGRSLARNHGANLAKGELLGFLDSDDEYLPNALALHEQAFAEHATLGLTVGGLNYIDAQGRILGTRNPWEESENLSLAGWLFNCYAQPATILIRHDWFARVGGFDPACEIAEDWDLFLQLALKGCEFAWVRQSVCQYRQHPQNSSRQLALHRDGSIRSLSKVFVQTSLPLEVASLKGAALAWVYVVFAHKALVANEHALARENLAEALRLDPQLKTTRKPDLLEYLLAPSIIEPPLAPTLLQPLAADLELQPDEVRQTLARVEMRDFFKAQRQGTPAEAAKHLHAGLKHDIRWLANRGVFSFWLKDLLGRA